MMRGSNWVLGNQLRRWMLVPDRGLTIRSQIRKQELTTRAPRMLRAIKDAHIGRQPNRIESSGVGLRLECRSYELGWMLWSFGHRRDLPELTHNPAFGEVPLARLAVPKDWPPAAQQRQHGYGPMGSYGTHNGDSLDAGPDAMKPVAR